jgi:hypothetical protein
MQLGNRRAAVVWEGTEKGNAGRVFPDRAERWLADAGHVGLRGHLETLPVEHRAACPQLPDRL